MLASRPEVEERVLALYRQFGWDTGLKKLQGLIEATTDEAERELLRFFAGWMAAERGAHDVAEELLAEGGRSSTLRAWALFGRASIALREKDSSRAEALMDQAEGLVSEQETGLLGALAHLRGANAFQEGRSADALALLRRALALFGPDHFGTGRVLDTFGLVYGGRDNFHAAETFFRKALDAKARWNDRPGLAISHGNLGRLYLDWGYLEKAEHHFLEDLEIARETQDERGTAQMYDHLGQSALECGERARAAGREGEARARFADAASWLDDSLRTNGGRWSVLEAYARKDRARVALASGDLSSSEGQLDRAETLFAETGFAEGLAHVARVRGSLLRLRGDAVESERQLRVALSHFLRDAERAEEARTRLELARTQQSAGSSRTLVAREYLGALHAAESCRRARIVQLVEAELHAVDPGILAAHLLRRSRGRAVEEDMTSLIIGVRETATVLFLDLIGSTDFARENDPEVVMMALNQMMADFVGVLRRHEGSVACFRGDGFLAVFRGQEHALRAVNAALDFVAELDAFNEPRHILGVQEFAARVGISTGQMVFGNVGTYDKMDFTVIGADVNHGARLEPLAEPGVPCISQPTRDLVHGRFRYKEGNPRFENLKGLGPHPVWDVIGRAVP
jgi:class 3 adenylate cyclase/tetratricopeptide (TPR) repeat protein